VSHPDPGGKRRQIFAIEKPADNFGLIRSYSTVPLLEDLTFLAITCQYRGVNRSSSAIGWAMRVAFFELTRIRGVTNCCISLAASR